MGETGLLENGITARGAGRWLDRHEKYVQAIIDGFTAKGRKIGSDLDTEIAQMVNEFAMRDNVKITRRCIEQFRYDRDQKRYEKSPRNMQEAQPVESMTPEQSAEFVEKIADKNNLPFERLDKPPVPAYRKAQEAKADDILAKAIVCGVEGVESTEVLVIQTKMELDKIIETIAERQPYLYPLVQVHKGNIQCLLRFAYEVLSVFENQLEGGVPAQDTKK